MPPPIGVVSGPLMPTRCVRNASSVSSGSQLPVWLKAFSPASTSLHWILRLPPYAFATAASNTRTEARQMSGPVPSPMMKGSTGASGTRSFPDASSVMFSAMGRRFSRSAPRRIRRWRGANARPAGALALGGSGSPQGRRGCTRRSPCRRPPARARGRAGASPPRAARPRPRRRAGRSPARRRRARTRGCRARTRGSPGPTSASARVSGSGRATPSGP